MAENSDGQDKIFDATPKRIEDAKKEGQVLTSKEVFVLSSMFSMILMGLLIYINSKVYKSAHPKKRDNFIY